MVKDEIGEIELKAAEWKRVQAGIKEIEEGRAVSFEEIKRDFARRKMAHRPGRQ
jgi:predicted transcriptional regulator